MPRRERLDHLYALIPDVNCKGLCQEFCGPIMMSDLEHQRLTNLGATIPRYRPETFRDDLDAGRVVAACPLLNDEGRCSYYEARPAICRLWGAVETMSCPHGCEPVRMLTDDEGRALLRRADEAGRQGKTK